MAYLIRENDFARFELIDAQTEEVIATSSHPGDLCELATCLLPEDEVSCLPQPSTERRVVEVLPGGVRRTEEPLSLLSQFIIANHSQAVQDWQYEVINGDTRLGFAEWMEHRSESAKF